MFSTISFQLLSLYRNIKRVPLSTTEALLSVYFWYCKLSPCTVELDDGETVMHIWAANHRRLKKANLVLVHGIGGNSKWQFVFQVASLSRNFNVYIPDLVFFGKSHSTRTERSDTFQANCVSQGMKKLGLHKFAAYGISYGGFVAYRMAEMEPEMVEKVVVVNCGIVFTEDQKSEYLKTIGLNLVDILVPEKPEEIRMLSKISMYKFDVGKWVPDFVLREFIAADGCKKEKQELVEYLLLKKHDLRIPALTQETLIIWGEKDNIFPVQLAYQLQKHLGPKAKLEILKNVGHAANMEAPYTINKFVTLFVTGG